MINFGRIVDLSRQKRRLLRFFGKTMQVQGRYSRIEQILRLAGLGFYQVRIILLLRLIFVVLGFYYEVGENCIRLWNEWVICYTYLSMHLNAIEA